MKATRSMRWGTPLSACSRTRPLSLKQTLERAMTMAHQLSMQLRASEERIQQLESEIEHLESRARRAEGWLQAIKQEIKDKLLGPLEARRPELPVVH